MTAIGTLKKRSDVLAFYGVPSEGGGKSVTYHRMRGFTEGSTSKNPKEYARQYIDEESEQTDVVGYSPSISYNFDAYAGNEVHADIVRIANNELTGSDAIRSIIIVDKTMPGASEGTYKAIKRDYAVIPDSEGDGTDAYTYSGNLKAKGIKEDVEVASNDGLMTVTITPAG